MSSLEKSTERSGWRGAQILYTGAPLFRQRQTSPAQDHDEGTARRFLVPRAWPLATLWRDVPMPHQLRVPSARPSRNACGIQDRVISQPSAPTLCDRGARGLAGSAAAPCGPRAGATAVPIKVRAPCGKVCELHGGRGSSAKGRKEQPTSVRRPHDLESGR